MMIFHIFIIVFFYCKTLAKLKYKDFLLKCIEVSSYFAHENVLSIYNQDLFTFKKQFDLHKIVFVNALIIKDVKIHNVARLSLNALNRLNGF